jgi:hypothetical protein
MNFYSASVAVLWLTAFRAGATQVVSRRGSRVDSGPRPLRGRAERRVEHVFGFNNSAFSGKHRRTEN